MTASLSSDVISALQSQTYKQTGRATESAASATSFEDILASTTASQESSTATSASETTTQDATHSGMISLLYELAGGSDVQTVNEEQLFASIIYDRISELNGQDSADQYNKLLDEKLTEYTRPDGYTYVEDAARAALRDMENSGSLTTDEAETIHGQAFEAAQLDDDTSVLYDSRGTTISVAATATAMEKSLAMLTQIDSGEITCAQKPLSYVQGQATEASGTATTSQSASATSGQFTHSAEYDTIGVANGGRQYWRIPDSGPDLGEQIKVVFEDGYTVYVNDTSHNYRQDNGFVFKPGIGPNGEGKDNTGTSHNGVFIHAPYGNNSKTVKVYW